MAELVLDNVDKVYDNGFHAVKDLSLDVVAEQVVIDVPSAGAGVWRVEGM